MRVVTRNNKKYYKYEKKPLTFGIKIAIAFFVASLLLYVIGVTISFLCNGDAPTIVGGIGVCAIIFNIVSMAYIVMEIYLYKNFQPAIRNMLFLQIIYFVYWVFVL